MIRRRGFNPKRRISGADRHSAEKLQKFARDSSYTGNPEHKQRPGDYGLTPAVTLRPGKTICDGEGEFAKPLAEKLLKEGFIRGLVSEQERDGWPQNVWSVIDGAVFEAQLENAAIGSYHGHPMPEDDEYRKVVLKEWKIREPATDN
jgi:hypothetical protein